jgi:prepilin-type N-terminal cleavage/methylation domain-containing protein
MTRIKRTHGFSLIELSVVLTVMAILSTATLSGMVAMTRNKFAEKMARDLLALHEAAEAYYHQTDTWPGTPDAACQLGANIKPVEILRDSGFISTSLHDPFSGEPYRFDYTKVAQSCHLRIHTPRNEKLATILGKVEGLLNLVREPICDEKAGIRACHFVFETPTLGANFSKRNEEYLEQLREEVFLKNAYRISGDGGLCALGEVVAACVPKENATSCEIGMSKQKDGKNYHAAKCIPKKGKSDSDARCIMTCSS